MTTNQYVTFFDHVSCKKENVIRKWNRAMLYHSDCETGVEAVWTPGKGLLSLQLWRLCLCLFIWSARTPAPGTIDVGAYGFRTTKDDLVLLRGQRATYLRWPWTPVSVGTLIAMRNLWDAKTHWIKGGPDLFRLASPEICKCVDETGKGVLLAVRRSYKLSRYSWLSWLPLDKETQTYHLQYVDIDAGEKTLTQGGKSITLHVGETEFCTEPFDWVAYVSEFLGLTVVRYMGYVTPDCFGPAVSMDAKMDDMSHTQDHVPSYRGSPHCRV